MENVSTAILIFLGIILFTNYRKGTLKQWLGAKFLNTQAAKPFDIDDRNGALLS